MTKVYADLDVLLDGRAAVAKMLDADALTKWGKGWQNRVHEHNPDGRFGTTYTHAQFEEAWANRDAETVIGKSIPTRWMWEMGYVVADWQKNQKVGFVIPKFTLVVNTWPYEFVGEARDALIAGVKSFLGPEDTVELLYRDPVTILPTEIRSTFTMVVFDRVDLWFAENAKFLEDNPIPNVLFATKRLALSPPGPNDDLMRMFEALEMTHSALMFYRCFGMDWFSYFIPPRKAPEEPAQKPDSSSNGA